jgi:F-type H+-transporting ATPase subunit gamma
MPSLKDLRNRIDSVKSTKKITQAMKMVAASKLKKAQSLAEKGRSYSSGLDNIVKDLVNSSENIEHPLLGTNVEDKNSSLIIVVSSDRGLCGGLNSNVVKAVKKKLDELEGKKKSASLVCIGKKGFDLLSGLYEKMFNFEVKLINIGTIDYKSTEEIGKKILNSFYKNDFQECSLFYNHFNSVISQEVKVEKLIPYSKSDEAASENQNNIDTYFEYEPNEEEVLSKILPKNFIVQIYKAILESRASEQGARMTAMDNATRNAGDMIDNLSLKYNRQRQAIITKELIEIISGAEAL